ncbi:hypothetical protein D3C76_1601870 [compost metagenome]
MPGAAAANGQLTAGQFALHRQPWDPGHAHTLEGHAFQAVGHRRFIDSGIAQVALAQQKAHRTPKECSSAVGQQRHAGVTLQIEQRVAVRANGAHRQHLGGAHVQ